MKLLIKEKLMLNRQQYLIEMEKKKEILKKIKEKKENEKK